MYEVGRAAALFWTLGAFMVACAGAPQALEQRSTPLGRSDAVAQSCSTRDSDRCNDEAMKCFRNCDRLELCNRSCCLALHDCQSSHSCNFETAFCTGF